MREGRDRQETTITLDAGKVRAALAARGLSAAVFAELAGVAPNTMTKALHERAVTVGSARKIATALNDAPVIAGLMDLIAS